MLKLKSIVNVYRLYVRTGLEPQAFIAQTRATAESLKSVKETEREIHHLIFLSLSFLSHRYGEISSYRVLSQTPNTKKKEHMVFTEFHIFCALLIDGK